MATNHDDVARRMARVKDRILPAVRPREQETAALAVVGSALSWSFSK